MGYGRVALESLSVCYLSVFLNKTATLPNNQLASSPLKVPLEDFREQLLPQKRKIVIMIDIPLAKQLVDPLMRLPIELAAAATADLAQAGMPSGAI